MGIKSDDVAATAESRDFNGNYTWVMSPRWYDKRTGEYLALDTGGGPIARLWTTALAGLVDIGYIKSTGNSVKIYLPKTAGKDEVEFEWKIPKWSNAIERDRARTYFQAYAAAAALYFCRKRRWPNSTPGEPGPSLSLKFPKKRSAAGFMKPCGECFRITLSSATVKSPTITPYPPTPWNANL